MLRKRSPATNSSIDTGISSNSSPEMASIRSSRSSNDLTLYRRVFVVNLLDAFQNERRRLWVLLGQLLQEVLDGLLSGFHDDHFISDTGVVIVTGLLQRILSCLLDIGNVLQHRGLDSTWRLQVINKRPLLLYDKGIVAVHLHKVFPRSGLDALVVLRDVLPHGDILNHLGALDTGRTGNVGGVEFALQQFVDDLFHFLTVLVNRV